MKELSDESLLPKNRLEALSDGIFAITMTLMILDLKTPENIPYNLASKELPAILYNLLPSVEAYAVSFVILGIFWLRHLVQFKYFGSVTRSLVGLNIFFLLFIGFVPFTVAIMMRYPQSELAFRIYLINLIVISIILTFQWHYCSRNKKITEIEIPNDMNNRFLLFTSVPVIIFLISFGISFINLRAAFFFIYLDPIFYLVYKKLIRKKIS